MKTHEQYLQELRNYGEQIVSSSNVQSSNNNRGIFGKQISFFQNYQNEIEKVSDQILEKANNILEETKNAPEIDNKKLKEDLTEVCQNITRDLINKTNRKFKNG